MKYITLLTFFIIYMISSAQTSMLKPISLKEQVEASSLIVEGEVIKRKSYWNDSKNFIYTLNTIKVYKSFKGECSKTINIATEGGRVDDHILQVSESLELQEGALGVFILKKHSKYKKENETVFEVVSDLQGFYRYDKINNIVRNPFHSFTSIEPVFYTHLMEQTQAPMVRVQEIDYHFNNHSNSTYKTAASISPLIISAGTGSVVTISGAGFGVTIGTVEFKNANDGGMTYQPALASQIISWSDTEIKVEVPAFAGTGRLRITDAASTSQETQSILTITFAQTNGEASGIALLNNLINVNSMGGYTWHMFTDFDANTAAKTEFLEAFSTWRCSSNINWSLGSVTSTDSTVIDGENVIRFDNGSELPMGVLGRCLSYSFLCGSPPVNAILEMDMIIDDGTVFHYGMGTPQAGQYDFQSVIVHELGHGHQLNHVIDNNDIMYYGLADGVIRRTLGPNDIAGSNYVQNRCIAATTCQFSATTALPCNIGIEETLSSNPNHIYPNPASQQFYILGEPMQKFRLYSATGAGVPISARHENNKWTINIAGFPSGIYLLEVINSNGSTSLERLVIE